MTSIEIDFVPIDSMEFKDAFAIRYNELYKDKNLPTSAALDGYDEKSLHCVAKLNGKVVGYGRLNPEDGRIAQMAVEKQFQHQGIGKQIVQALMDKGKELKLPTLFLLARTGVQTFYERFGFYPVGKTFISPRTKIPHIRMKVDI